VGLERVGASLATRHALEFTLAHAQARDAVHAALSVAPMVAALRERGLKAIAVNSAARDRAEYLRRPDLGRRLSAESAELLAASSEKRDEVSARLGAVLSIILADGLSALAVERHAIAVLDALLPHFGWSTAGERESAAAAGETASAWRIAPVVVAEQARVALGDEIGAALGADVTVMLIGERPGLSAPDSLGAYITWAPQVGRTDAERNCVSNIRAEGLSYAAAAERIAGVVREARRLGLTGVGLRAGDAAARGLDAGTDGADQGA
jgi:ethanolamine ammonia-lyase small subunit